MLQVADEVPGILSLSLLKLLVLAAQQLSVGNEKLGSEVITRKFLNE